MREDFNIKRVSVKELWRLTDLTLAQLGAEIPPNLRLGGLRRAEKRLSALLSELKLRGVQLELDLREREQISADGHVDPRVVRARNPFSGIEHEVK